MNDRDELDELWASQPRRPQMKGEDMLEMVIRKASRFDRMIAIRNAVECVAAGAVAVIFGTMAFNATNALMRAGNAVVAASGLWIIFYMLRYSREAGGPAPDQTLAGFRQALLRKYEHQIRLLKRVKFWYLLPPYMGLLLWSAGVISERAARGRLGWAEFAAPVIYTSVFAGVWWLNEVKGVRWLNGERRRLAESAEGAEGEER
jgi:hypothetical protein